MQGGGRERKNAWTAPGTARRGAMNSTGSSIALGAILALLAADVAARAQPAARQTLVQIDRTFVCPESLPSDEARSDALKLFLEEVAAVQPTITVKQITDFRTALLRKHQCRGTLANIDAASGSAAAPGIRKTDDWERAGSISGSNGMVITVDMDSMISAGPGKMRTWIKYHYNGIGPKDVKESMVYEQLDCARNYHSTISLYSYRPNGQIVLSGSGKAEDEEPIIPESMLAGILPFTCAAHGLRVGQ